MFKLLTERKEKNRYCFELLNCYSHYFSLVLNVIVASVTIALPLRQRNNNACDDDVHLTTTLERLLKFKPWKAVRSVTCVKKKHTFVLQYDQLEKDALRFLVLMLLISPKKKTWTFLPVWSGRQTRSRTPKLRAIDLYLDRAQLRKASFLFSYPYILSYTVAWYSKACFVCIITRTTDTLIIAYKRDRRSSDDAYERCFLIPCYIFKVVTSTELYGFIAFLPTQDVAIIIALATH